MGNDVSGLLEKQWATGNDVRGVLELATGNRQWAMT